MKRNKEKLLIIFIIIIILFLIYLMIPYFTINKLTIKYGSEFLSLYSENGFYEDIEYLKVLQYRDEKAKMYYMDDDRLKKELSGLDDNYAAVLYIEENHSSASVFIFDDVNGEWRLSGWYLIWSVSGTADGFIWPYYF